MYCPKCGNEIKPNTKFCAKCGNEIGIEKQPIESEISEDFEQPLKTKSKKPLIVVVVVIAIVILFTALYFGLQGNENNPFAGISDTDGDGYNDDMDAFINDPDEWKDSDNDGIGDNTDIYNKGNAVLYFNILSFSGDTADFWTSSDPYFLIWFDINDNDEKDEGEYSYSITYQDTNEVDNPHQFSFDIDDDIDFVWIIVSAYDEDLDGVEVFDIETSSESKSIIEQYSPKNDGTFLEISRDGSIDNDSGYDGAVVCQYGIREKE